MTAPSTARSLWVSLCAVAAVESARAQLGHPYCDAVPNSTGAVSTLTASGSSEPRDLDVTLRCTSLPPGSVGYFLVSSQRGAVPGAGGGTGTLCLAGAIGRYSAHVLQADPLGSVALSLDLTAMPHPAQPFAVASGSTLHFQYWHRDQNAGAVTSNLSRALSLTFCPEALFPSEVHDLAGRSWSPELGDLDGDGFDDLVFGGDVDRTIVVMRGLGQSQFDAEQIIATGQRVQHIALGDLDGDGDLDIAYTTLDRELVVVENLGNFVFAPPVVVGTGHGARGLALGDLDLDGDLDVVQVDEFSFFVLLNSGGGQFTPAFSLPSAFPRDVALADLDGDGFLDVILPERDDDEVEVHWNDGVGGFTSPSRLAASFEPYSVAIADLDGDSRLDIVVAEFGTMSMRRNLGARVFGARELISGGLSQFVDVHAVDLDADGDQDLLALDEARESALFFENDGAGVFLPPVSTFVGGSFAHGIPTSDLDQDGDLDAVVATSVGYRVLENRGNGRFPQETLIPLGGAAYDIELADLDGDGHADVVVPIAGPARVAVLRGRGDTSFDAPTLYDTGASPSASPVATVLFDLGGDGDLDIAVGESSDNGVVVLENTGSGQFVSIGTFAPGVQPAELAAGDIDGDGLDDLVVGLTGSTPGLVVSLQSPGATFTAPIQLPLTHRVRALSLADLDGDGDLDVVALVRDPLSNTGDLAVILVNDGTGTGWSTVFTTNTGHAGWSIAVGDVDDDGDLDAILALTNVDGGHATVLVNQGEWSLRPDAPGAL